MDLLERVKKILTSNVFSQKCSIFSGRISTSLFDATVVSDWLLLLLLLLLFVGRLNVWNIASGKAKKRNKKRKVVNNEDNRIPFFVGSVL